MASLPPKNTAGQNLKQYLIRTIDAIIDYLHATRIRPGYGIDVRETPAGTEISLKDMKTAVPCSIQKNGGTASGLTATVSGGTATVAISGSTALVIEPGANIQISGGTNGELIISATGGGGATGFPDYFSPNIVDNLAFSTVYGPFNDQVWLIGKVFSVIDNDDLRGDLTVWIYGGTNGERIDAYNADIGPVDTMDIAAFGSLVSLPIPAGNTFQLMWVYAEPDISDLRIYPCIRPFFNINHITKTQKREAENV